MYRCLSAGSGYLPAAPRIFLELSLPSARRRALPAGTLAGLLARPPVVAAMDAVPKLESTRMRDSRACSWAEDTPPAAEETPMAPCTV